MALYMPRRKMAIYGRRVGVCALPLAVGRPGRGTARRDRREIPDSLMIGRDANRRLRTQRLLAETPTQSHRPMNQIRVSDSIWVRAGSGRWVLGRLVERTRVVV